MIVFTLLLCSIPIGFSYVGAVTGASNSSFTIRSFEWLRDHGAARIASQIESVYYSMNAPSTGGAALHKLPLTIRQAEAAVHPPNVVPADLPALPGEGVWAPSQTFAGRNSPVQVTQFRSDPLYPQMVGGRGVDQHLAHLGQPVPGSPGALGQPSARADDGARRPVGAAAGHVQQRLQAG